MPNVCHTWDYQSYLNQRYRGPTLVISLATPPSAAYILPLVVHWSFTGRSLVVYWSYTGPLLNVYSDKYFSNKTCCTIKEPRWGERCCNDDLNCMKNHFSCVPQRSTCVPSCLVSGLSHLAPPTLDKYLQENFRPSSKPLLSAAQTIHSHKGLEKATATRKHRHPHINGSIITWAEIEDGWKPAPLSDPVRVCKIKNTIYGICYIQRGSGGGV